MFVILAAVAALSSAAPVEATAASADAPAPSVVKKKQRMICENVEGTGSRMSRRVCRTAEEVERNREATRKKMDSLTSGERLTRGRDFDPSSTPIGVR